ncbi:MAG: hypothetical protein SchgKO_04120 [Schleiferiaceae bacterium]
MTSKNQLLAHLFWIPLILLAATGCGTGSGSYLTNQSFAPPSGGSKGTWTVSGGVGTSTAFEDSLSPSVERVNAINIETGYYLESYFLTTLSFNHDMGLSEFSRSNLNFGFWGDIHKLFNHDMSHFESEWTHWAGLELGLNWFNRFEDLENEANSGSAFSTRLKYAIEYSKYASRWKYFTGADYGITDYSSGVSYQTTHDYFSGFGIHGGSTFRLNPNLSITGQVKFNMGFLSGPQGAFPGYELRMSYRF